MTNDALKSVRTRKVVTATPQTQKASKGQKRNNAGGYSFKVTPLQQVERFLILGSENGYYESGAQIAENNSKNLRKVLESSDAEAAIDLIVEISKGGRAAKQQPGLFALAMASSVGTITSKKYALSKLPEVARTATSLFQFIGYALQFRGWGRSLREAVAAWYTDKDVDKLAYQMVKYQSREGFTHHDVAHLSHPKSDSAEFNALMQWAKGTKQGIESRPAIVSAFEEAKTSTKLPKLIKSSGLSWEMLPTEALNDTKVWDALLEGNVPLGALIRQLPRLTRLGILKPLSATTTAVVARLTDQEELRKARIHPVNVLVALRTYQSGRSDKGDSTWTPVTAITDALDRAFYLSFKTVEPSGKRFLNALDVSGSMGARINNSPLTARDVSSAMSLVVAATEPATHTIGFTGGSTGRSYGYGRRAEAAGPGQYASAVTDLAISPRKRLDTVIREIDSLPYGSTDCALPMLYALERGLEVDVFSVYTDNETYAGSMHPHEALTKYRKETGIPAKLVVVATHASKFSVGDPNDAGTLNISGFDTATPGLITQFAAQPL